MKLTLDKIQNIGYLLLFLLLMLLLGGYYSFFKKFQGILDEHDSLLKVNNLVVSRVSNLLISINTFNIEVQKREKGDPLKAIKNLSEKKIKTPKHQKDIATDLQNIYNLEKKLKETVGFYVSSLGTQDTNINYDLKIEEIQVKSLKLTDSIIKQTQMFLKKMHSDIERLNKLKLIEVEIFGKFIFVFSISIFIVVFAVFYFVKYLLTNNFLQVLKVAKEIGQGNFDVELDFNGSDIISKLNFSIMKIKNSLQNYINKEENEISKLKIEVTKRKEAERERVYLAKHDFLTVLLNRGALQERLEKELLRAKSLGQKVSYIMLDIDYFKDVNDVYGHDVGDKLLIEIANRLKKCCRPEDLIARLGGDEFAIVVSEFKSTNELVEIADKLLEVFKEKFEINELKIMSQVSIGISVFPDSAKTSYELYKNSDIALYYAKQSGKNCYKFFSNDYSEQYTRYTEIGNALKSCIENEELFLVFQPIVNMTTNEIVGAEALLRWKYPQIGKISPSEFIPIAEMRGLIANLGAWVVQEIYNRIIHFKNKNKLKKEEIFITINISPEQLKHHKSVTQIIKLNTQITTKYKNIKLKLELTESDIIKNISEIRDILKTLNENKIEIIVDDFGTGASSLQRIEQLPVSTLKIDKIFIKSILKKEKQAHLVRAIIYMSKMLNFNVIAEGVESKEQMDFLIENGCVLGQGYFLHKPMTFEEFINVVFKQ